MKNFTKQNFKTNPLWIRLLIMTFMLLLGSSAWAWTVIYDNSETQWEEVYLYVGKGNWSECNLKMTEYDTDLFFYSGGGWDDATEIAFGNANLSGSTTGNICGKLKSTSNSTYSYNKDFSKIYKYKASGIKSADGNCSNNQRNIWPDTNARIEVPSFDIKKLQLAGDFNSWGSSTDICFSESGSTCSFEKELSAKSKYEFKIIIDGTWYSSGGSITVGGNKVTFYTDKGNSYFKADNDGIYTFNIDKDKKVWITYRTACTPPDAPTIKINGESSATLCSGSATITTTAVSGATLYSLYKGNATNASQTNTTGTFTVSEADTYYVTVTTCAESQKSTGVTLSYYTAPTLTGKYSITNATKCNNTPNEDGVITIQNGVSDVIYSLNDNVGTSWSNLAKGTYTLKATLDACSNLSDAKTVEVGETDKTPAINNISIKEVSAVCKGQSLTLQLNETAQGDVTYTWYKSNTSSSSIGTGTSLALTNLQETSTYFLVASKTENDCTATKETSIEITVNPIPDAPTFTSNEATVCSGVAFNLNEKFTRNSGETGTLTWYKSLDDSQVENPASVTITETTSYYAKATNNNCTSDKSAECTVNVDAQPTLALASSPTVCPNVEIDLDTYVDPSTIGTVTWYSDKDRTNVITDGLVTPTEQTTYYASSTNGVCDPAKGELVVNVYGISDEMPAYTQIPATSCKETPNNDGQFVLMNPIGGVTYTLDEEEGESNVWTSLSAGTHKLAATVNACTSLTKQWDVEVGVEDITPIATVSITGNASFCEGGSTELTSVVTATEGKATGYQWYNGENLIQGATASTYTANAAGNYKVVVTVLNSTCQDEFWSDEKAVTINPKPSEPVLSIPSPICAGSNFTLPEEDNNQRTITWNVNNRELTNLSAGDHSYTAKIVDVNGCESSEVTYTITVNPLPTINIEKTEPAAVYKYADVKLKANGDNISTVAWTADKGTIKGQPNHLDDSKRAMLTYDQKGTVTVTATATSEAGCTATSSAFQVVFGEEDCAGSTSTDLVITCNPNGYYGDVYLHIWPNNENSLIGWPGFKGEWSNNVWKWTFTSQQVSTSKQYDIIFNNNSGAQTQDLDHNLVPGNQYNYTLNHTDWGNDKNRPTMAKVNPIPTIKTVSVNSNEDGVLTLNGMVVATGCNDQAKLGLQYKKQNQDGSWPDAYTTVEPNTKDNISKGKTFTTTVTLEEGTYMVRACAHADGNLKGYGYDVIITVSTTKTPISNVTLDYCNENGGNVGVNPMCKGAYAYMKLAYEGSTASEIKWLIDGEETTIVEETAVAGVYSFAISRDATISVKLRNDANVEQDEVTPAYVTSEGLTYTMIAEPAAPYISIDPASGVICDGANATITVTNPTTECSYKLVREGSKAVFTPYESGDLTYSVSSVDKYYVVAQHNACTSNEYTSNQVAITQVISTSAKISIEPENQDTTPWEPVSITVTADEGYIYEVTYTTNNLADVDGVIIKQSGNTFTYRIPRPAAWGTGNEAVEGEREDISYGIKAQLKVDGEANQCDLSFDTATITVKDEENENCD